MSLYRNVVWYCKGLDEYTKKGYLAASKHFRPNDLDVDGKGKSYMITGANSGIGKATATDVAKKGGTIHMVCRSKERGEQAKNEIIEASGNSNINLHLLDMSNPRDVWKFAKNFESKGEPLNVLVNNAGCMVNEREMTKEGLEKNFATNTLGTYVLTMGLLPVLQKTEKPRVAYLEKVLITFTAGPKNVVLFQLPELKMGVPSPSVSLTFIGSVLCTPKPYDLFPHFAKVIVSSGGMLVQQLNVQDLMLEHMRPFDGTMAYAQNKRQQVVMAEELAKKFPDVHFSSMHPGWADTPAVRSSMPSFYEKMKDKLRTAEAGADTLTWLCLADSVLEYKSGEFFQDRKPVAKHLPLAWTKPKRGDQEMLMKTLDEYLEKFKS